MPITTDSPNDVACIAESGKIEVVPVAPEADGAVLVVAVATSAAVAPPATIPVPLLAALIRATNAYADYTHGRQEQIVNEYAAHYESQRNLLIAICLIALGLAAGAVPARTC